MEIPPRVLAEVDAVVTEASGRGGRHDPVTGRTGGPAGNARLTSWAGLVLLVVGLAELVTLLDVRGLLSWHIGVGIAMTAVALLKTATTGWRILRYYTGSPAYRAAGPPPMLLRALGPLVVLATLGVLGSGIALVALGPSSRRQSWFSVLGQGVGPMTLHQAFFAAFMVTAGLHLLARFVPAVLIATGRHRAEVAPRVPGRTGRAMTLALTAAAGVLAAALVVPLVHGWDVDDGPERVVDSIGSCCS